MKWQFEAFNDKAAPKRGLIEAANHGEAVQKLRDMGLYSLNVEPENPQELKTVLEGHTDPVGNEHVTAWQDNPEMRAQQRQQQQTERSDWQREFETNMNSISRVHTYLQENWGNVDKETETAFRNAISDAVKQAVLKSIKSAGA